MCASSAYFINHHLHLAAFSGREAAARAALTLDNEGDRKTIEERGVPVHGLNLSRKSLNPFRVLAEAAALRRIVKKVKPDLVNPIALKSVLVTLMAAAGLSCGVVASITGLGYLFSGNNIGRRLPRLLTLAALTALLRGKRHELLFSNTADRDIFLDRRVTAPERMRIVPIPGVDIDEFAYTPEPESGFRVVLPARMLWEKGVAEFVEAAAMVKEAVPEAEFILAGLPDAGNPESIGEEQLRKWSGSGVVSWIGYCGRMPELLASCHVVCLPSYYREGFPRVLVEALACGRPIVTADAPGCRDVLDGTEAGLLAPPRNAAELARALKRLYMEPETRQAMGRRGRRKVEEELSREKITGEMAAVFEQVGRAVAGRSA
ncbi:MAG: glycosyltransferase family 4 protein [Candidatus Adiutrix sp.]|nr:glycosyltransferase family 4 protein [Candidatus Adiutrix sp.]